MAAPTEVTLSKLDGKYVLNNKLSDSVDAVLALQSLPWLIRKTASLTTPKLTITTTPHPTTGTPLPHTITITSVVGGGLIPGGGSTETNTLDWSIFHNKDPLLGEIEGWMGWDHDASAPDPTALVEGLGEDKAGLVGRFLKGNGEGGKKIKLVLESKEKGWKGETVWGFEEVEGGRRYVRRLVFRKGEQVEMARLVYDWLGA